MCKKSKEELDTITSELVERLLAGPDINIEKIILYGSYARGDENEESDIDIMVLCDNTEEELDKKRYEVNAVSSDLSLENDIDVAVKIKNNDLFEEWLNVVPFYQNIEKEGVELYGRAYKT